MCMTGAAQNLLSLKLAASLGVIIVSPWLMWFKAGRGGELVGDSMDEGGGLTNLSHTCIAKRHSHFYTEILPNLPLTL